MLAGLIFATDDADDRPDLLAATLPFAGGTLIEFQARLLIAAGVGQLLIVAARLSPELLGAVNRLTRRGLSVDIVRTAAEAEEKLHPLARVLVVADALVTTDEIVRLMSGEGGDALLVTGDADALPGLERVGANAIWAGIARVEAQRIADVAALPRDYDFQSTLLRVTAQAGAQEIALPQGTARAGHGIERAADRLRQRNDAVLAAFVSNRPAWVDRYVVAPIARRLLPLIVARGIGGRSIGLGAGVALTGGLGLIAWGWPGIGIALALAALVGLQIGADWCWMRDEQDASSVQRWASSGGAAASVLLLGWAITRAEGTATAIVLALALVFAAALIERGAHEDFRARWWGSPLAYPLVLLPFALAGQALIGLAVGAGYAAVSLAAVIEVLREKP